LFSIFSIVLLIAKLTSSNVPTQSNGFVSPFPVNSKNVFSKSDFSNKSSPKISTNFSLSKYGLSIIYANKHLAQLQHHLHSSPLLPTLQLLKTL